MSAGRANTPAHSRHFELAIEIYGENYADHPNRARALVNAAYVKRLIALDLRNRVSGRAKGADHVRYLEILQEALELLRRAGDIYSRQHHQAGTGSVLVNAGHLHLDSGDIDRAEDEAQKGLCPRRRKTGPHPDGAVPDIAGLHPKRARRGAGRRNLRYRMHAHLARDYAEEAIALAKLTQNSRLLAGAYIARSSIAANEFFEDWDAAKQFCHARRRNDRQRRLDHLSKQLSSLKTRILRATGIDEMLRAWSEGIVGDKTFQQVTEEFAELVIPKVWAREGRKIARVAERLSISPKKVRRILNNVDMLRR